MPRARPDLPDGFKKCCTCKEVKPHSDFSPASRTWDKLASSCKPCALASTKKWLAKRKAEGTYEEVKRKRRESMKRSRDADPDKFNERNMRHSYGIGWKEYSDMLIAQEGKCAICSTTKPGGGGRYKGRFHVDHCHATGAVRGLLCYKCNTGIACFHDLPHVLEKAIHYVRNPKDWRKGE